MTAASPPPAIPRWLTAVAAVALVGAGALIVRQVVTSPPPLPVETATDGAERAEDASVEDAAGAPDADAGAPDRAAGVAGADAADAAELHGFVLSPAQRAPDVAATEASGTPWRLADRQGKVVALFFGYTSCPDVCPQTLALLAAAKAALAGAPAAADAFEVAMITVDPERDTADVLARYMAGFDPSFIGLEAGDGLQSIADAFGATYMRDLPPDLATQAAAIAGHDEAAGGDDHDGDTAAGGDDHAGDGAADDHHDGTEAAPHGQSAGVPGGFERGSAAYTVAHSGVVFLIDPAGRLRSSYLAPFDPAELAADVTLLLGDSDRSAKRP